MSEHLHRLKPNSIKLLEEDPETPAEEIKFSMVADFDYATELKKFKAYINNVRVNIPQEKVDLFQEAIFTANNKLETLPLKTLA